MATSISDIRFKIESQIRPITLDDDLVIDWCNEANADIGINFNLPGVTGSIELTATDLSYTLPTDLKIINRLRLQSVIDEGIDRALSIDYRIYNGQIILPRTFWMTPETLVIDYYKHLATFTSTENEIELEDRYAPIYVFYGLMKYYELPESYERYGDQNAMRRMNSNQEKYLNIKSQLQSYQMLSNEPVVIEGRW